MTIHLPENREHFVRSLVQAGRYASADDVIEEALRLLEQRDSTRSAESRRVENLLLEGLDSGQSTPMTASDWDDIEREGKRLIANRQSRNGR